MKEPEFGKTGVKTSEFEQKISPTSHLNRNTALQMTSDLIRRLHKRACNERFREQEGDRARVAYARVLVSALQAYAVLLKDAEIEAIENRIAALESTNPPQKDDNGG